MPTTRRPNLGDRRRLVIYSQRFNEDATGAVVRVADRTSDGRRNQAAYGSRVQRRLRARWYGLVPVKNRTLWSVAAILLASTSLLGVLHWCAFWWGPIAAHPEIARPFRLDRPDSFGTWFSAILLATTAGASFLVYQLRRYKSDDYHGHYRIWRIAIVLSLVASLDCVTGLVSWFGGTLDVLLAERDFLAGSDWIRLLLGFGGAAFALRLVTEVSRSGWAALVLVLSFIGYGIPLAVRWKIIETHVAAETMVVPIAITFARAGTMLAVVIYLRLLYREVRRIESGERLAVRLRGIFKSKDKAGADVGALVPVKARAPRRRGVSVNATESEQVSKKSKPTKGKAVAAEESRNDGEVASGAARDPKPSFWSKLRRSQLTSVETQTELETEDKPADVLRTSPERESQAAEEDLPAEKKRSSWLKLPRRRPSIGKVEAEAEPEVLSDHEGELKLDAGTRGDAKLGAGKIRGWFKSRKSEAPEESLADDRNDRKVEVRGRVAERGRQDEGEKVEKDGEDVVNATATKRRWLGIFGGKAKSSDGAAELGDEEQAAASSGPPGLANVKQQTLKSPSPVAEPVVSGSSNRLQSDEDDEDASGDETDVDFDSIDWDSLNKSERRRMRKVMKRQGKAA